jgi:Glyoxalase-like domain
VIPNCDRGHQLRQYSGMPDETPHLHLQVGWVCVDCVDPKWLAAWWQRLIGGEVTVDDDGDVRLDGGTIPLLFLRVAETKVVKNRVHLDLRVTEYDEAVARALALGATPADEIYQGPRWRVLRDPEGNEFCVLRPELGDRS